MRDREVAHGFSRCAPLGERSRDQGVPAHLPSGSPGVGAVVAWTGFVHRPPRIGHGGPRRRRALCRVPVNVRRPPGPPPSFLASLPSCLEQAYWLCTACAASETCSSSDLRLPTRGDAGSHGCDQGSGARFPGFARETRGICFRDRDALRLGASAAPSLNRPCSAIVPEMPSASFSILWGSVRCSSSL